MDTPSYLEFRFKRRPREGIELFGVGVNPNGTTSWMPELCRWPDGPTHLHSDNQEEPRLDGHPDRNAFEHCGFSIRYSDRLLLVTRVLEDTPMAAWNQEHPTRQVQFGSRIRSVNGKRTDIWASCLGEG
eukprot:g24013.t1